MTSARRETARTPAKPRTAARRPALSRRPDRRDVDLGAADQPRGGVQSIARAFAILEEIARHRDGLGLAALSKRVRLHNSTAFHLVRTLVALGYVRQVKDGKRYRVGGPLFALAASALDELEMTSLATPVLEDLARDTGETAHFAVRMGGAVVVLARSTGPSAFQLADRVGVVRPAHCTALGKVILAGLPPEQLDRFLAGAELKAFTAKSITHPRRLRREIAHVRRAGLAFDDAEFDPEVRCVALPVHDFTGQVAGAIGLSGPVWRLSIQTLQGAARVVRAAADRLSAAFGRRGNSTVPTEPMPKRNGVAEERRLPSATRRLP
jgi:DNA-binding IclR family transcriptional regulator